MKHHGYEIMQFSLCEGWANNLYDGNGKPIVFSAFEHAIAELQVEFDDWAAEIAAGKRRDDEGYDIGEFQILCAETGKVYELGLKDGEVIISSR